ncbi:hypothetical protein [Mucilaginibacter sp.]|uniref:hypothetical protein n=1 Tax=Mucilaginibacter sp. TaxID=1882438 RepID=UPI00284ACF98|nr:hypothetical protein [Mucilaginibacter sp.]MDR3694461.1 hypothetical protein [Mucilaginibacter sp.]
MKPFYLTQFKIAAAFGLCLAFQSCVLVPGSWKNDKISSGKRDDFHTLNNGALKYLKADDPKGLVPFLSKDMIAANNERTVEQISIELKAHDYALMDEFYVVNKSMGDDTVLAKGPDITRYGLKYPYKTTEMYFAFFTPKKCDNKYMVSLIYGKFDYGWKIIKMDVQRYTINGKTAPELFALARDQYEKKDYQASLNNISLAIDCFKPNEYIQYPDEVDATPFYNKVREKVNETYHYPLILRQVSTGPMILRVYNDESDEGSYPMIYYMTHFPLKDTTAVKKENTEIRKAVGKMFPGLDDNNNYILYSAFNERPTGYNTVGHFDMKIKAH